MSYINRRFYESKEKDPNGIWQYLSCVQKVAYFQFQNSSLDLEDIFCDDINIRIVEKEDRILISRNGLKTLEQCFDVQRVTDLDHALEYIKDKIDNDTIIGVNTYFYDIPNFIWYQGEANRNSTHICMIVGYDENYMWLVDVPSNIRAEYVVDQHLTKISINEMKKYLDKRCNLLTFQEKHDAHSEYDDLGRLLGDMLKVYTLQPYHKDGGTVWKGQMAFERLLYLLQINDSRVLKMELYHGEYMATIISGRRELLKRKIIKNYGRTKETENVLNLLEICARKWELLGHKILKDVIKNGSHSAKEEDILHIYESEKLLMEGIKQFYETIRKCSGK